MRTVTNIGHTDRLLRFFLSEVFFIAGYFWFGGTTQIVLLVIGSLLLATSLIRFCGIYVLLGVNTCPAESLRITLKTFMLLAVLIFFGLAGSYYSAFFTKKFFLNDYNLVNNFYKQTLFLTGKNDRDGAIANFEELKAGLSVFANKYENYHPYILKSDKNFNTDISNVRTIVSNLENNLRTGDLSEAHLTLETIRPVFQDILKRNNISLLAVALVDFHDAMEEVLDAANEKDVQSIQVAYEHADLRLETVEEIENDSEIQNIREKLEAVRNAIATEELDNLPILANELKNAFVKVYLSRG